MVGLEARRQPAGKPDGVAEARDHPAFRGDDHEVLVAHDLGDRGGHLRRDAGRERGERRGGGALAEQPVAEAADGEMGDRREGAGVVGVDDEARDLVVLVRDDRLVEEMRERQVGERHLRRHAFGGGRGGDAGEAIARARRRRLGEQGLQIGEGVPRPVDRDRMHRCRAFHETARTKASGVLRLAISEQANRQVTIGPPPAGPAFEWRCMLMARAPPWHFAPA